MNLSDFETLAAAKSHEVTTYKLINSGAAMPWLAKMGVWDKLENNTTNTAVAITETGATVGSLCKLVLAAAQGAGFQIDPGTEAGAENRALAQLLVDNNVFTGAEMQAFFALGETVENPFATATEYDFQKAKGTLTLTEIPAANISQRGESAIIITTVAHEQHSPILYAADGAIAGYFNHVESAGLYVCNIKTDQRGKAPYSYEMITE